MHVQKVPAYHMPSSVEGAPDRYYSVHIKIYPCW